jgi:hypothetical protein
MLDPVLHSTAFVRSRSALLFTTLLALGSTALATLPNHADEQVSEALSLHAHVEKLNLVVYTTGARSIEIMQAQIVGSPYIISSVASLTLLAALSMGRFSENSAGRAAVDEGGRHTQDGIRDRSEPLPPSRQGRHGRRQGRQAPLERSPHEGVYDHQRVSVSSANPPSHFEADAF